LELFFEDPDREDARVLFEREDARVLFARDDLLVVFDLELELEFDDFDFDDARAFEPLLERPLLERLDPD